MQNKFVVNIQSFLTIETVYGIIAAAQKTMKQMKNEGD